MAGLLTSSTTLAGLTATDLPNGLAAFGQASTAAIVIAVYLYVGEPVVGLVTHRRFEQMAERVPSARRWLYSRLLILEWGLVVLVGAVVVMAPKVSFADLGVRAPDSTTSWIITGVIALAGAAIVLGTSRVAERLSRNEEAAAAKNLLGSAQVVAMLPRTSRERRLFAAVAVTAGVAEELIYRGFFLVIVAAVLPGVPIAAWVAIIVVGFGLAHLYQGATGMVITGVLGALLAGMYLITGSLLAPVVFHACIDLRALALSRLVAPRSRGRTARVRSADRPGR